VRPNRGTTFTRHLTPECVGAVLAADVMRARGVPHGVCVDSGVEPGAVACAWEVMQAAQAAETSTERVGVRRAASGRRHGQLEGHVGCPNKPIVGTMHRYLGRVKVGGGEHKEDA